MILLNLVTYVLAYVFIKMRLTWCYWRVGSEDVYINYMIHFAVRVDCIIFSIVTWNLLWGSDIDKKNRIY